MFFHFNFFLQSKKATLRVFAFFVSTGLDLEAISPLFVRSVSNFYFLLFLFSLFVVCFYPVASTYKKKRIWLLRKQSSFWMSTVC